MGAPEVLINDTYGKEVDWWSLGCVLHLMLTGRYAFQSDNTQKLYNQIVNKEIKFNKSYWQPISKEAKDLVNGLLNKDPKKRYCYHNIIEHEWIKKHCQEILDNLEESSSDNSNTKDDNNDIVEDIN